MGLRRAVCHLRPHPAAESPVLAVSLFSGALGPCRLKRRRRWEGPGTHRRMEAFDTTPFRPITDSCWTEDPFQPQCRRNALEALPTTPFPRARRLGNRPPDCELRVAFRRQVDKLTRLSACVPQCCTCTTLTNSSVLRTVYCCAGRLPPDGRSSSQLRSGLLRCGDEPRYSRLWGSPSPDTGTYGETLSSLRRSLRNPV